MKSYWTGYFPGYDLAEQDMEIPEVLTDISIAQLN